MRSRDRSGHFPLAGTDVRTPWRTSYSSSTKPMMVGQRPSPTTSPSSRILQECPGFSGSSLAVEGELPEDGLAAYGDDGDDLMLALARQIVAGEEDAGSVESVFAQAQQVAAEAEALLVDAEWAAPEPEPVAAEIVTAGQDEADESQRSLFSWAEFLADTPEEPGPPRGRRRHEAPTLSLFEWALDREQEAELAVAG